MVQAYSSRKVGVIIVPIVSDDFLQTAAAIDRLFHDALTLNRASAFDDFLEFAQRLSNLSIFNAMLVQIQRPGVTAVATEKQWLTEGGYVRAGAIPIVILRPFGPVAFVYEYADVYGISIPGEVNLGLKGDCTAVT